MNANPFYVEVALASPVILSNSYLTLDGILAAAIFAQTNDPVAASSDIPLKKTGSVWHASQAFFSKAETGSMTFTRRLGGEDMEPGAWLPDNEKSKNAYRIKNNKDDYMNVLTARQWISAKNILWFGCGDLDKVRELLQTITSVGAKRAQGFGEINQEYPWRIVEMSDDRSFVIKGSPARPIPIEMWRKIVAASEPAIGMVSISLPAWASPKEMCAMPDKRIYSSLGALRN